MLKTLTVRNVSETQNIGDVSKHEINTNKIYLNRSRETFSELTLLHRNVLK